MTTITKTKDYNSSKNQEIKGKFIGRDVYCNVNSLMENQKDWENGNLFEEIENLSVSMCPECEGNVPEYLEEGDTCIHCAKGIIEYQTQEILEWWAVSNWFAEKLKEEGQPIYDSGSVMVWGRCCSGQAILLDGVISRICEDMEILEGQKYEWTTP